MRRIKIIKPNKKFKVGEIVYVTPNEAHDLIDGGFGQLTKDMTATDYRTENGRPAIVRTHRRSKR